MPSTETEYTPTGAVTITNPTPFDARLFFGLLLHNNTGGFQGFFLYYSGDPLRLSAGEVWTREVQKRAHAQDGPNFETTFDNLSVWFEC